MDDTPTCGMCPAFLFAAESLRTGRCHGCRSGPPTIRVESPPAGWRGTSAPPADLRPLVRALAERVADQSEVLARRAERRAP